MAKKRNDFNSDSPQIEDEERAMFTDPIRDGHKEYTVHRDGTVINGELLNQGDVVTLHPDDAAVLMNADVRLTEVPPSI